MPYRDPAQNKRCKDTWRLNNPEYWMMPKWKLWRRNKHRRHIAKRRGHMPPPMEQLCPSKPELCELCGKKRQLGLDHDHNTGNFRGWLCGPCNRSLGVLGDSEAGLQRASAYLKRQFSYAVNLTSASETDGRSGPRVDETGRRGPADIGC